MPRAWVAKRQRRDQVEWYVMWYDDAWRPRARRRRNSAGANRLRVTTEQAVNNGGVVAPERSNWPELVEASLRHKSDTQAHPFASVRAVGGPERHGFLPFGCHAMSSHAEIGKLPRWLLGSR
ncbi:MAG TPA: hypothetical protein PLU87_06280 [Sedimentisphaerales bacterium]|nr:hypothetical protein [Sedimentisphaerales bacterium]HRS10459.1 hypothetical protein [Sedimentisphaerales bacterium]HRV47317.1 hypothetical protein [Sedimentisphaerales bacterium]